MRFGPPRCKARSPVCRCRSRERLVPATRHGGSISRAGRLAIALPFTSLPSSSLQVGPAKWVPITLPLFVQEFGVGRLEGPMSIGTGVDLRAVSCSFEQQRGSSGSLDR